MNNMKEQQDPSEIIRIKLNELPEKDSYGNYNRFGNQFITWLFGGVVETANDHNIQRLGKNLRRGAEKSFGDYIGQKIADEISKIFKS